MDTSTSDIEKQLENLCKTHEGYRALLDAKHEMERVIMTREGCSFEERTQLKTVRNIQTEKTVASPLRDFSEEDLTELSKKTSGYSTDDKMEETSGFKEARPKDSLTTSKTPRKFLRRGEGIKQRFKIAPDAFNLSKLPPYKYANAHPELRRPRKRAQIAHANKKHTVLSSDSTEKQLQSGRPDAQEQNFRRLLLESKTVANSTPEPKSIKKPESICSVESRSTNNMEQTKNSSPLSGSLNSNSNDSLPLNMAWSKVLNPFNIKPITISDLRIQTEKQKQCQLDETVDEQLNLFELLEEKAKEGSFQLNSSLYKQVLAKKTTKKEEDEQDTDIIPVRAEIREAKILPRVTVNVEFDSSDCESNVESDGNGDEDEDNDSTVDEQEICEETIVSETNETTQNDNSSKSTSRLHVHFVDQSNVAVPEETVNASQIGDSLGDMDTEMFFEHAKGLLLEAMTQNQKSTPEAESSNPELSSEEIKKLAEQGKERLSELEKQIALFKESNAELLRAMQEHNLEKVSFMQMQQEALEEINDEKVKMEIQFHDERMKLEKERQKLEEKIRMSKNAIATTERKEITKLKGEITALQAKLKDREQAHVASQGRLRAQLRCFEKEQKDLYAEIERLKKENKKLEKLNAQLSRERNVTILNEINRNIVKLAGNKNATTNDSEIPPMLAKGNSAKSVYSANLKKPDSRKETAKTQKITTTSFKQLLTNSNAETSKDSEKLDVEEFNSNESEADNDEHSLTSSTNINTNAENKSDISKSEFKVLTRETTTEDGGKEFVYQNGTIRKESGDGLITRMMYFNGDLKETNVKEGTIKYYYAKTNTWHTTYLDGLEILEFPNGQIEHRLPNGITEIHFPNNSIKVIDPKDKEKLVEWRLSDGSTLQEMRNGDKVLTLPNGQKEFHTKEFKRRVYPDGTIKTVFPDGSYETRYSNGRIRLKDKDGKLIVDSDLQGKHI